MTKRLHEQLDVALLQILPAGAHADRQHLHAADGQRDLRVYASHSPLFPTSHDTVQQTTQHVVEGEVEHLEVASASRWSRLVRLLLSDHCIPTSSSSS